jgi:hypothetical protein
MNYLEEYAEIDGRIYLQAILLLPQGQNDQLSEVITTLVFQVQYKLKSLLYHKERYALIENHIINEAIKEHKDKTRIPDELFFEFEAFLFQMKSTLDITVKVLEHLFPNTFKVTTFASKGSKLIKNLTEYRKQIKKQLEKKIDHVERLSLAIKYRNETIDNIIDLLKKDEAIWLSQAIDKRDTVSHYRGSFNLREYVFKRTNGELSIEIPDIIDLNPHVFLKQTYCNCIEFIQDFICLFIELWLPPMFALTKADEKNPQLKAWAEQDSSAAKYVKFSLGCREWV